MAIAASDITGLVLAGGRGSRMGGVDKGLQPHRGQPLAQWALERLRPQAGALAVNANRNHARYAALGVPVWPDADGSFAGPLAGWLAGLAHCRTDWLLTVPCDCPRFPLDLAPRLAAGAVAARTRVALASCQEQGGPRLQPVFALLHRSLHDDLAQAMVAGARKVDSWTARHAPAIVAFDEPSAFFNANTLQDLDTLQSDE